LPGRSRNPPFSKGETHNFFSPSTEKALLPLKKGGGKGFLGKYFKQIIQTDKLLRILILSRIQDLEILV
jgi:hypothetical protein